VLPLVGGTGRSLLLWEGTNTGGGWRKEPFLEGEEKVSDERGRGPKHLFGGGGKNGFLSEAGRGGKGGRQTDIVGGGNAIPFRRGKKPSSAHREIQLPWKMACSQPEKGFVHLPGEGTRCG